MLDLSETGDVVDVLLDQHEQIKKALSEVANSDGPARAEAFERLCSMLEEHEQGEQEVVHPITEATPSAEGIGQARVEEEEEADRALAHLRELGTDHEDFADEFTAFHQDVLAHAEAEERTEFPRCAKRTASSDCRS